MSVCDSATHPFLLVYVHVHPDKLSSAVDADTRAMHEAAFKCLGLAKDVLIKAVEQNETLWRRKLIALIVHQLVGFREIELGFAVFNAILDWPGGDHGI